MAIGSKYQSFSHEFLLSFLLLSNNHERSLNLRPLNELLLTNMGLKKLVIILAISNVFSNLQLRDLISKKISGISRLSP
jgi:hypothetical protein